MKNKKETSLKKINFADRYQLTQMVVSGEKTQTRRIIRLKLYRRVDTEFVEVKPVKIFLDDEKGWAFNVCEKNYPLPKADCPKYTIGEIVAVAQPYARVYAEKVEDWAMHKYHSPREDAAEAFKREMERTKGWSDQRFVRADLMPHQIRIVNIRVERLQDVTEEDCLKEGIRKSDANPNVYIYTFDGAPREFLSARTAYADLIDCIYGRGTWQNNPYVFVYEMIKQK